MNLSGSVMVLSASSLRLPLFPHLFNDNKYTHWIYFVSLGVGQRDSHMLMLEGMLPWCSPGVCDAPFPREV